MITKIISGLLGVSIVLSSNLGLANNLYYVGRDNDGESLYFDLGAGVRQGINNQIVFDYYIKTIEHGRTAHTPWCTNGQFKLNPEFIASQGYLSTPGWYTKNGKGDWGYIKANSPASLKLIKTACKLMDEDD